MLDDFFFPDHTSVHSETSFADPIANEHVIFLPGGKVMVVDWGIQSFAKNVVSIAIAGVVAAGAAAAALLWADERMKQKRRAVTVQRSGPAVDSADENDDEDEE